MTWIKHKYGKGFKHKHGNVLSYDTKKGAVADRLVILNNGTVTILFTNKLLRFIPIFHGNGDNNGKYIIKSIEHVVSCNLSKAEVIQLITDYFTSCNSIEMEYDIVSIRENIDIVSSVYTKRNRFTETHKHSKKEYIPENTNAFYHTYGIE